MRIKIAVLLSFLCVSLLAQDRSFIQLDEGWKFINEDILSAPSVNLDDKKWENVQVPHDWAINGPLSFVTIEVMDKEGNLCPRDASLLFVKVQGNGTLKALCNGDATDLTPFSSNYMRVFNGKKVAIVQSTDVSGEMKIIVSGERLKNAELTISTKELNK